MQAEDAARGGLKQRALAKVSNGGQIRRHEGRPEVSSDASPEQKRNDTVSTLTNTE